MVLSSSRDMEVILVSPPQAGALEHQHAPRPKHHLQQTTRPEDTAPVAMQLSALTMEQTHQVLLPRHLTTAQVTPRQKLIRMQAHMEARPQTMGCRVVGMDKVRLGMILGELLMLPTLTPPVPELHNGRSSSKGLRSRGRPLVPRQGHPPLQCTAMGQRQVALLRHMAAVPPHQGLVPGSAVGLAVHSMVPGVP